MLKHFTEKNLRRRNASENVPGYIPYTPRAKKIIEAAKGEAKALGHAYVGTEHLLLGLLGESEGAAALIFKIADVDVGKLRAEILKEITSVP